MRWLLLSYNVETMHEAEQGEFRYAVAAVARLLIRARMLSQPRCFSPDVLRDWQLEARTHERMTTAQLLKAVQAKLKEIEGRFMWFCESGGYSCDASWNDEGDVGQVKIEFASFVDPLEGLPWAMEALEKGKDLDWDKVANWGGLPTLRRALDRLPKPRRGRLGDGPDDAGRLCWKGKSVTLGPVLHRLCRVLWDNESMEISHVVAEVWGEKGATDNAIKTALNHLNEALAGLQIPWAYHKRGKSITAESS